jgi:hypothetical protein
MQAQYADVSWWAVMTIWAVVNAVNTLQGIGFLSRVRTGTMTINYYLGFVILLLAIPAAIALIAFIHERANWIHWIGPIIYLVFIVLLLVVDYIRPVEFRSPMRPEILVPFLVLFFGGILFMGVPMFRINRPLWLVTAATTVFHLISMAVAMRMGVG